MTLLPRALRTAALPAAVALAASAVVLTAGCQSSSSSSSSSAAGSASSAAGAVASAAPGASAALASAAAGASGALASITGGAVVPPSGPVAPAGSSVYLAEGGDVGGTALHAPRCGTDCPISGDSTTLLSDMTWPSWTGIEALGTGTEKINDCTPNCASGKLYAVKVAVALTKPVHVCADGTSRWYWTQIAFTWPDGLPAAFRGANAPSNPMVYSDIASQSTSCAA
jgi:hypothetical protein